MSHVHRLSEILDSLVIEPSVEATARRLGMTSRTIWSYLFRSKRGDAEFQAAEFCGTVLPFHQAFEASKSIAARALEQNAISRATSGSWQDSYFQGRPQFEPDPRILAAGDQNCTPDELELYWGQRTPYLLDPVTREPVRARVWMKPSETLVIKLLESWDRRRYGAHQTVEVKMNSVLRLERPDEASAKPALEPAASVFDEIESDTPAVPRLALGRPARSSEELDQWNAQGDFKPTAVRFIEEDGSVVERTATPDPLLTAEQQPAPAARAASPHDDPEERTADDIPADAQQASASSQPRPAPLAPAPRQQRDGEMGYGHGTPAPGGFKIA